MDICLRDQVRDRGVVDLQFGNESVGMRISISIQFHTMFVIHRIACILI